LGRRGCSRLEAPFAGGAVPGERLQLRRDMRRRKQGRKGRGVVGSLGKWGGDGGDGHLLAARRRRRCRGGGAVGLRQRGLPETVPIQRHRLQPANGYKEWARGASGERALAEQARARRRARGLPGLTGGVEAAGGPCGGVAGVAPPAAPAAGEVACRDAAAFLNFGAKEALRKTGRGRPGGKTAAVRGEAGRCEAGRVARR
jgi:hypothetical protein